MLVRRSTRIRHPKNKLGLLPAGTQTPANRHTLSSIEPDVLSRISERLENEQYTKAQCFDVSDGCTRKPSRRSLKIGRDSTSTAR